MQRDELVKALGHIYPALANNDRIPALLNFCFNGKQVMAYDSMLGIIAPCETEDTFSVHGKTLLGLLSNSHSEEADFSMESEQDILVKSGKSRFHLPYWPIEDFLWKEPDEKWVLQFKMDDGFAAGLEACLMTTSVDLTQQKLLGIAFVPNGQTMALYSCNSDALTRFQTSIKKAAVKIDDLIPKTFCESLLRIRRETEAKTTTVKISKDWICGHFDNGYRVYGNLQTVEGGLVDYEALIDKTLKGSPAYAKVPKELAGALARARVVADIENSKTIMTIGQGKLKLHTETKYSGLVEDTIPWPDKSQVTADVAAMYVQQAIGVCDSMTITERCTAYKKDDIFILVSNMG